ncbi:MAG TPA: HPP family protein [Acidobacteriaceae bacterium]|jgi:hypothetical protein|nr:HPP family protein [Acidobacteriaceae bacterium]
MHKRDLLIAPLGETFLILIAALAGWVSHQPLIFASLGPTAYELIETPHRRSARPYSIFIGHLTGVTAAYLALVLTHSWHLSRVSDSGVPFPRIWAAVLASGLTVFGTLLLRASQPAAISTTLLIATGIMQTPRDAAIIMGAVVLMLLFGEPLRRWRLNEQNKRGETRDEQAG